jgi:hypothetical protein
MRPLAARAAGGRAIKIGQEHAIAAGRFDGMTPDFVQYPPPGVIAWYWRVSFFGLAKRNATAM